MVANNQSIIYDIDAQTETVLPEIPNGVRVTAPTDGSAILLPLSPPDYVPEVLVCGGSAIDDRTPPTELSSQHPASSQCSRITLTLAGIARGWEVEHMLEPRTLTELLHIPNGQVLISNGARKGFSGFQVQVPTIPDSVGNSHADDAALVPSLYTPAAPRGQGKAGGEGAQVGGEGGEGGGGTVFDFLLEEVDARARVLLGVVPALAPVLDLPSAPLLRQPRQPRLQRPPARVRVHQRGVDAARVADLERVQVRLQRVPKEDRGWGRR